MPLAILWDIAQPIEQWLLRILKKKVRISNLLDTSSNADRYVASVRRIIDQHSAASHEFYDELLPAKCSVEGLAFYLRQESTLDPYFDDLLAILQVGAPLEAKSEIGQNYFDEIGCGKPTQAHSYLFAQCAEALSRRVGRVHDLLPESLVCGNLSVCLALHRQYYPIGVGYFGATEDLAPRRFRAFLHAWQRCNLPSAASAYQQLHAELDIDHADGWWRNVAYESCRRSEAFRRCVELGILLRLESSTLYLDAVSTAISPFLIESGDVT
jgi:pyrroloquinoline quinone (PQQ) biosynthesis protein C